MEYWFYDFHRIRNKLNGRRLAIMLDFDGTLSPIVKHPDDAEMSESMKALLTGLASQKEIHLAVLSGRSLEDISHRVGIPGICYAGNHGLEIEGCGISYRHPLPDGHLQMLDEVQRDLHPIISRFPGSIIENKGASVSIHFRNVHPDLRPAFCKEALALCRRPGLKVRADNLTLEVLPDTAWNKGKALEFILAHTGHPTPPLPIYIGDALTDEDAFGAANATGYSVRVGGSFHSAAQFFVYDVEDVEQLLRLLLEEFAVAERGS
jgi:trehalose-phosphatase